MTMLRGCGPLRYCLPSDNMHNSNIKWLFAKQGLDDEKITAWQQHVFLCLCTQNRCGPTKAVQLIPQICLNHLQWTIMVGHRESLIDGYDLILCQIPAHTLAVFPN